MVLFRLGLDPAHGLGDVHRSGNDERQHRPCRRGALGARAYGRRDADVDLSTIAGTLNVVSTSVRRGRLSSVTGDIRVVGAPPGDALLELSNHEGAVDLRLPRGVSGVFDLSTITGTIENGFTEARP